MKKQAFTLVELIVVITILAILGTIGFISLQGFSSDARDSKRISELSEIRGGLQIYQARNSLLPTPSEQSVTIGSGSTNLIIQGYVGESVLNEIKMNGNPKDPLDDNKYYIYSVNASKTRFQLLALLENDNNLTSYIVPKTHASYENRHLYTLGQNVGMLLNETTNTPIQELTTAIDLNTDTNNYKVVFANNNETSTLSGELLYNEIVNQTNNNGIAQNSEPESTPITCPTGYIVVPGNSTFSTSDFCVAKYEMKWNGSGTIGDSTNMYCGDSNSYLDNSCLDGNPGIISQAELLPLRRINQPDAIQLCNNLGEGYHLITNNEWMTIARNIEQQNDNWSGGITGSGGLYRGNNTDGTVGTLDCNDVNPAVGVTDNINLSSTRTTCADKRQNKLSNGEIIHDLAGNVREHVNGTNNILSTTGEVLNGQACSTETSNWYSFYGDDGAVGGTCLFNTNEFYSKSNHGPLGDYNENNGVGRIYSRYDLNNRIFIRGGTWTNTTAGIFTLNLTYDSANTASSIGFRCAFSVN